VYFSVLLSHLKIFLSQADHKRKDLSKWLQERREQRAEDKRSNEELRIQIMQEELEEKKRLMILQKEEERKAAEEAAAKKSKKKDKGKK
jgi:hypothetical protein